MRCAEKFSIQPISPAVVRALNAGREFSVLFLADAGPTVPANVVESANPTATLTRNNDAFTCYLAQEIITRVRNLCGTAAAKPHFTEDRFQLSLEHTRIRVVTPRQCFRLGAHGLLNIVHQD